jgi:hydroxylamine reductase
MFCHQCQEAAGGKGCEKSGVCGKSPEVSDLQDLLMYLLRGISVLMIDAAKSGTKIEGIDCFVAENLFATITNTNFDKSAITERIKSALENRETIKKKLSENNALPAKLHDALVWSGSTPAEFVKKAESVGYLSIKNEDLRSLKTLLELGIKGMAAYATHAAHLGRSEEKIFSFIYKGLASLLDDNIGSDDLVAMVLECGARGVDVMALLDEANTSAYGNPEITKVNIGVGNRPGILVSGHDLKDLEELLKQTEGSGIDVYTHSEMLPAHYYPAFKKYSHFVGNYGNAWWKQKEEFESFNGPVLFTTNCIVPPRDTYKDRVYTTNAAGFEGIRHIPDPKPGAKKDFSNIIEHAKKCKAPVAIESGEIVGGFAHTQVMKLAPAVIDAVKTGKIKKFLVMAGCDGRMKSREYYTQFAEKLPRDTVILTAGCAKYRYNKLKLGDIDGIPRILDAGQCNDSYSLAVIALKLKEAFNLDDINKLPISYNIAWYEQKAVIVLLALLYLGVKNIHLGPTLPAFLSANVAKVLAEKFGIAGISTVDEDVKLMAG